MSSGELRPGISPETTSCSSCTSSQSRTPRSTGSIRSPASSLALVERVAADEDGALEDRVVELARPRLVRADRADERPGLQPLAAEHRVLRGRDRDDDVLLGRVAMRLAGLGADFLAELLELLLGPAVGDDALDRRARASRMHATWLSACQPQPMTPSVLRVGLGEVLRSDTARRSRAELAHLVGLDHRRQLGLLGVEEHDDERRPTGKRRIGLETGEPELLVDGGHHGERTLAGPRPRARPVLDRAPRHSLEARLDSHERVGRRQQLSDLGFGQSREAEPKVYEDWE